MSIAVPAGVDPIALAQSSKRALARRDYIYFVTYTKPDYVVEPVHAYLGAKLQEFVEKCERKESPRLMILMAPQHGKSQLSSRQLPPYILGRNPKWRVGLMSHGADWARGLAYDARGVLLSDEYQSLWPTHQLDSASSAVDNWKLVTKSGGSGMVAVGREGSITGRSLEVLIVDDPVKDRIDADSPVARENAWKNWTGFRNRVQRGGGVLVLYTPWHYDDLPSRLRAWGDEHPDADQWEVISLPAIAEEDDPIGRAVGDALAPNRYDISDLNQLRASMPESEWQALYCCRPTSEQGAVFVLEHFKFEHPPRAKPDDWTFQAADTAFSEKTTADYSVIGTWRVEKDCYRLLDVYRKRMAFPELKTTVTALAELDDPLTIVVEDKASGQSLIQELQAETKLPVIAWRPDRDKVSRANAVTHLFKSGKVRFPIEAPWLRAYLAELLQFPAAAHDDQVDMTTMALTWAREQQPMLAPTKQTTHAFTYDAEEQDPEMTSLLDDLSGARAIHEQVVALRQKAAA